MKTLIRSLALLMALSVPAQLPPKSPQSEGVEPARLAVLHATTQRFVDEGKHAGIITLLARDGKVVDSYACGYRDIENGLPMQRDTICRVYSMSKIITCVGTLILFEEGRFNLDDPVANYLPELKDMKVWAGGTQEILEAVAEVHQGGAPRCREPPIRPGNAGARVGPGPIEPSADEQMPGTVSRQSLATRIAGAESRAQGRPGATVPLGDEVGH